MLMSIFNIILDCFLILLIYYFRDDLIVVFIDNLETGEKVFRFVELFSYLRLGSLHLGFYYWSIHPIIILKLINNKLDDKWFTKVGWKNKEVTTWKGGFLVLRLYFLEKVSHYWSKPTTERFEKKSPITGKFD